MDDASPARLDQQVLAIIVDELVGLSSAMLVLLTTIVQNSDSLLDKRNGDNDKAMALLTQHADLQEKLSVTIGVLIKQYTLRCKNGLNIDVFKQ